MSSVHPPALIGALCAALLTALATSAAAQPATHPSPVTETHHGVRVTDPYRGLERMQDPAVLAWMRAQDQHARKVLGALPERGSFHSRLAELDADGSDSVQRVQRTLDGRLFYLLRRAQDNQFKLVVRAPGDSQPRVVADPMALAAEPGVPQAITRFRPSPSGTRVGVVVSASGSEAGILHVIDVATGRALMPPMDRADWALPGWLDEDRFVTQRLQALSPGQSKLDKYRRVGIDLVHLASAPGGARHVALPLRQWADLGLDDDTEGVVRPLADNRTALGLVFRGVQKELALYVGDWSRIEDPAARWQRLVGFGDGVVDFSVHGRTLYGVTHQGAPRHRVLAWSLDAPGQAPREVLPPSARVVLRVIAARDALYVLVRDGNVHRLLQIAHSPGAVPREIALPFGGQIWPDAGWGRDVLAELQDGLVFGLQGWTRALEFHAVRPDGTLQPQALTRLTAADAPSGLISTELLVPSHDGAGVPLSLVHRADVRPDGQRPVWLQAYASYGFTQDPTYRRDRLAWLERGGVLAFANPRGSGVFGQDWYLAGKGPNKPNTWLDVIACAEHLVKNGWTSPRHLGFSGRSAGGMLAGRVLTARPDLFSAVVPGVGVHDMLRAEFEPNGPPNNPGVRQRGQRRGLPRPESDEPVCQRRGRRHLPGGAADARHQRPARGGLAQQQDGRTAAGRHALGRARATAAGFRRRPRRGQHPRPATGRGGRHHGLPVGAHRPTPLSPISAGRPPGWPTSRARSAYAPGSGCGRSPA